MRHDFISLLVVRRVQLKLADWVQFASKVNLVVLDQELYTILGIAA